MKNIIDIEHFSEFDNLEFIAKQIVEGYIAGLHKSPFHGFSVEFAEHRLYNKGESTKFIDWKIYAKTDNLYIKQFEEETNLRAQIVLDNSSSMLFPYNSKHINKLSYSVYCAAVLIYMLRMQRDAVGLSLINKELNFNISAKSSTVHLQMLYNKLRELLYNEEHKLNETSNTAELLHRIAENVHKRSLVIIFSDMFGDYDNDELFSALQHLRHAKHEVIIFNVTDKSLEQNFDFPNTPHKFIDLETGEKIKINPNEIRDYYSKNTKDRIKQISEKCGMYKISFVNVDIREDFAFVLQEFLIKRKKMI